MLRHLILSVVPAVGLFDHVCPTPQNLCSTFALLLVGHLCGELCQPNFHAKRSWTLLCVKSESCEYVEENRSTPAASAVRSPWKHWWIAYFWRSRGQSRAESLCFVLVSRAGKERYRDEHFCPGTLFMYLYTVSLRTLCSRLIS